MDKKNHVIIDIGSNCVEFHTTIKTTKEEMERLYEGFRQLIELGTDSQNQTKKPLS